MMTTMFFKLALHGVWFLEGRGRFRAEKENEKEEVKGKGKERGREGGRYGERKDG